MFQCQQCLVQVGILTGTHASHTHLLVPRCNTRSLSQSHSHTQGVSIHDETYNIKKLCSCPLFTIISTTPNMLERGADAIISSIVKTCPSYFVLDSIPYNALNLNSLSVLRSKRDGLQSVQHILSRWNRIIGMGHRFAHTDIVLLTAACSSIVKACTKQGDGLY